MQWIQGKEPQRYGIFQVDSMWYYIRMSNNLAFPFQLSLPCFTMYAVLVDPLPLIAFSKVYSCPFIHVLEPLLTIFPSHFWFFTLSLTLCNTMDYTVHGILRARLLEWVAFPFSRWSSQPRDWNQVSRITGGFFTGWTTREAQEYWSG